MSIVHGSSFSSSRGHSRPRGRGRVVEIPKICWCGISIWALISQSDNNMYRCYYRCGYATKHKLENDEHTFKWVDEALINEIDALQITNGRIEKEVKEIVAEIYEIEQIAYEKIQVKIEKEIFERMDVVLGESSSKLKKMMVIVGFVFMVMVGCSMLVG